MGLKEKFIKKRRNEIQSQRTELENLVYQAGLKTINWLLEMRHISNECQRLGININKMEKNIPPEHSSELIKTENKENTNG